MKQSLAARFLFRAVVLAFLVYAMLLTCGLLSPGTA